MEILKIIGICVLAIVGIVLFILLLTFPIFLLLRACNKLPDTKTAGLVSSFIVLITGPIMYSVLTEYKLESWVMVMIIYPCTCLLCYCFTPVLYKLYKKINPNVITSNPRVEAGARKTKYNYTLWSTISFVVAALFLTAFLLLWFIKGRSGHQPFLSRMFFVFLGVGLIFRRTPLIYKNQPKEITEIKHTSFVLFLRGFKYERDPFYSGPYLSEFGKTNLEIGTAYNGSFRTIIPVNFEIFFSHQIKAHIGELVGLGNPEDILPHESIKMIYTLDDWRKQFFSLAQAATCIVVQPCLTESLRYELTELLKAGFAHKLYFFTKPRCKNFIRRYFMWLGEFGFNRKPLEWSPFETMLHQIGFTSNINVQKGAVVSFNENNETVLLKENCKPPSEYIKVVKADLNNKGLLN